MRRCRAAGKTRHSQIETAPKEMHWTTFPAKLRSKLLEQAVALHQNAPESIGVFPIVRAVLLIFIKRNRVCNLVRHFANRHRKIKFIEGLHHRPIKIGNRSRSQVDRSPITLARIDVKLMIDEIKSDLERPQAVWNRRSR